MKSDKTTPNVPTLRFAEFTDEWGKYELSHFVTRITRRNKNNESSLPLTISAQYGLVDQISFLLNPSPEMLSFDVNLSTP